MSRAGPEGKHTVDAGEGSGDVLQSTKNLLKQTKENLAKKNLDYVSVASYAIKVFQTPRSSKQLVACFQLSL